MKKLILAVLALTLTTALDGCGSTPTPSAAPAASTTGTVQGVKQILVDVTSDFWGVSSIRVSAAGGGSDVSPVTNATVTAGGVSLTYDPTTGTYLKGATVTKQARQVEEATAGDPAALTVDVSLDGVVTVKEGTQPVTGAIVTMNGTPYLYHSHAYSANPPGAPYVKASVYNYEGQVTEMSVYATDYLGGPENLTANMSFNGNHLTYCNPGYALGGVPVGQLTDYENALNTSIAAGATVNFSGTVAGVNVSASAVMPSAPVITGATSWYQTPAVWNSNANNTITWSGASPVGGSGTSFKLVVKTPMSLGGLFLGPIFNPVEYPALTNTVIPSTATSFTIPAGTLPPGAYALYLGLQTTSTGMTAITNADPSGGVQFQVYGKPLVVQVQ